MGSLGHVPIEVLQNMIDYSNKNLKEHRMHLRLAQEQVARCTGLVDYELDNLKQYNEEIQSRVNKEWGLK